MQIDVRIEYDVKIKICAEYRGHATQTKSGLPGTWSAWGRRPQAI